MTQVTPNFYHLLFIPAIIISMLIYLVVEIVKKNKAMQVDKENKLEVVEFFVNRLSGDYQLLERARKASRIYQACITLYYEVGGKLVSFDNLEVVRSIFSRVPSPFIVDFFFHDRTSFEQKVFVGAHFKGDGGFWSACHTLAEREEGKRYTIMDKAGRSVTFFDDRFDDQGNCAEEKVLRFIAKYCSVSEFLFDKTLEYMRDSMRDRDVLELCKVVQKWRRLSGAINADLDFEGALQEVE